MDIGRHQEHARARSGSEGQHGAQHDGGQPAPALIVDQGLGLAGGSGGKNNAAPVFGIDGGQQGRRGQGRDIFTEDERRAQVLHGMGMGAVGDDVAHGRELLAPADFITGISRVQVHEAGAADRGAVVGPDGRAAIGQVDADAAARAHAGCVQRAGQRMGAGIEFGIAQPLLAVIDGHALRKALGQGVQLQRPGDGVGHAQLRNRVRTSSIRARLASLSYRAPPEGSASSGAWRRQMARQSSNLARSSASGRGRWAWPRG